MSDFAAYLLGQQHYEARMRDQGLQPWWDVPTERDRIAALFGLPADTDVSVFHQQLFDRYTNPPEEMENTQ